VDPISGFHTQNVERTWGSGAKQGNKKRRGTKRNFLDSYLAEFMRRSKLNGRDPTFIFNVYTILCSTREQNQGFCAFSRNILPKGKLFRQQGDVGGFEEPACSLVE